MSRYWRWDGSQDPLGDELDIGDVTDRLAEEVLEGWGIESALRRLIAEGVPEGFEGLDRLRERIARLRREAEARIGRPDLLAGLNDRIDGILATEREVLAADPREEARLSELELDALPDAITARLAALEQRRWASPEAGSEFGQLLEDLRRQMLDAWFADLSAGLTEINESELTKVKNMMSDLNQLLEQRRHGSEPSPDDFDSFIDRHVDLFPDRPSTLDELIERLGRRAAAMSRFLGSLAADRRGQLEALMTGLLDDVDLAFEIDRLSSNLRGLSARLGWDDPINGGGDVLGLAEGLARIEEMARLEELERVMRQDYPGARLEDIDVEALREVAGTAAATALERLKTIERALEEAGVILRSGGRVELTARGVRKLGERSLVRVFDRLTMAQTGRHESAFTGGSDEPTGTTRSWRFGDPLRLDLGRTVHNAVLRSGPGTPVSLHPDDFEIAEAEYRTSVATVVLLDMSRSMPLRGHWLPAKRMALALHTLIATTYPEDHLSIIGFSDYARKMTPADLAEVDWEPVYGTNMEHAFALARRILSRHRDASKQVLLVTDGEPTAHLEGERVYFNWPPVTETLERTYREAVRLARSGATINVFMLEQDPGLAGFVEKLARMVNGRVFSATGEALGDMVVADYVKRR